MINSFGELCVAIIPLLSLMHKTAKLCVHAALLQHACLKTNVACLL